MANEDKKDFNAMLHDSKDMPKFQIITDQKSIEKYGGSRMYFAPPIDYDKVMNKFLMGRLLLLGKSVSILLYRMGLILQSLLQPEYLYLSRHGQAPSVLKMKLHTGEL